MADSAPVFPKAFLNHCPKVKDYRRRNRHTGCEDGSPEDDHFVAECAFVKAGCGMKCENCFLFLTRPFNDQHPVDREFLPQIENYYKDLHAWETQQPELAIVDFMEHGAGI